MKLNGQKERLMARLSKLWPANKEFLYRIEAQNDESIKND